uniref:Uncharacterized protein n=1 Tax=Ditylenchus dipsaci TaxID=166011 RepID=A0A915CWZ6_9BILA
MTYDYEAPENLLLWVAWLHRDVSKMNRKVRDQVRILFGDEMKPGLPNVFKNTVSTNAELWKLKHLIERSCIVNYH